MKHLLKYLFLPRFGYLGELFNVKNNQPLHDGNTLSGESIRNLLNMGLVTRTNGMSSITKRGLNHTKKYNWIYKLFRFYYMM